MLISELYIYILLTSLLTIAVINDLMFKRIPNILTFFGMISALIFHTSLAGLEGFYFSIKGIGLGMAILILFYAFGGMGAGDVKLMGAVGGLLGPEKVFNVFIFTALIGGCYSILLLLYKGYLSAAIKRYWLILKTYFVTKKIIYIPSPKGEDKLRLCYAVAIAFGTFFSIYIDSIL